MKLVFLKKGHFAKAKWPQISAPLTHWKTALSLERNYFARAKWQQKLADQKKGISRERNGFARAKLPLIPKFSFGAWAMINLLNSFIDACMDCMYCIIC